LPRLIVEFINSDTIEGLKASDKITLVTFFQGKRYWSTIGGYSNLHRVFP